MLVLRILKQVTKKAKQNICILSQSLLQVINVTFTVTLDQNGATTEYEHTATITTGMEKGKSYNFTATLTPENVDPENEMYPIEFTANVGGWGDFTKNDITVE